MPGEGAACVQRRRGAGGGGESSNQHRTSRAFALVLAPSICKGGTMVWGLCQGALSAWNPDPSCSKGPISSLPQPTFLDVGPRLPPYAYLVHLALRCPPCGRALRAQHVSGARKLPGHPPPSFRSQHLWGKGAGVRAVSGMATRHDEWKLPRICLPCAGWERCKEVACPSFPIPCCSQRVRWGRGTNALPRVGCTGLT